MIHVVVTVLTVSADTVEVFKLIQIGNQVINLCIGIEVSRIGFLDLFSVGVLDIRRRADDAHGNKFLDCHVDASLVIHVPEAVALCTEVFQTNPNVVFWVFNHVR